MDKSQEGGSGEKRHRELKRPEQRLSESTNGKENTLSEGEGPTLKGLCPVLQVVSVRTEGSMDGSSRPPGHILF